MHNKILLRSLLLFLATICLALAIENSSKRVTRNGKQQVSAHAKEQPRDRRAVKKPGFIKTLFQVMYQQWGDTKNTVASINKQLSDNFLPEDYVRTTPAPSNDPNVSTTTEVYKIKRSELNKILMRNLRGIVRLYNIELKDALKQSDRNYADFKKNASIEVSKYL